MRTNYFATVIVAALAYMPFSVQGEEYPRMNLRFAHT